jgi:hypothetical protein
MRTGNIVRAMTGNINIRIPLYKNTKCEYLVARGYTASDQFAIIKNNRESAVFTMEGREACLS